MPTAPTPPTDTATPSLHAEQRGAGPRLVMAHGFTQTGRVWAGMDEDLARDHQVVTVDMPGHGGSADVRSTLVDGALRLGATGGPAAYLGYSMGARFCLHLALARPQLVESLVLISGTAGIDDTDERLDRCRSDGAMADRLDPTTADRDAESVAEFLRAWMANPMFAGIGPDADGLAERLTNTGPGLASSLRRAGTGMQLPLWEKLGRLTMPVLVVCGEHDEKFTALGRRMAGAIGPTATVAIVAGAGHAPHLHSPAEVAGLVRSHLAS
jgi:2-succinyl-6-hydroxy-2,4-cyclohexadiene-1-carboxylate synthase